MMVTFSRPTDYLSFCSIQFYSIPNVFYSIKSDQIVTPLFFKVHVYPDNQVLLSLIVIEEKGKNILLAMKNLVKFIFHQKDM